MAKLVSKVYGEALYDLAIEKDELEGVLEEVLTVSDILKENEEFIALMQHPELSPQQKGQIVRDVFAGRVSDDITGFMLAVEEKGRFGEILAILDFFIHEARKELGVGEVHVTSAISLSEDQKKKIEDRVLATTTFQKLIVEYQVDAGLIGGLVIRIGDRVVDSSIRTELATMARELSRIQLNV